MTQEIAKLWITGDKFMTIYRENHESAEWVRIQNDYDTDLSCLVHIIDGKTYITETRSLSQTEYYRQLSMRYSSLKADIVMKCVETVF